MMSNWSSSPKWLSINVAGVSGLEVASESGTPAACTARSTSATPGNTLESSAPLSR